MPSETMNVLKTIKEVGLTTAEALVAVAQKGCKEAKNLFTIPEVHEQDEEDPPLITELDFWQRYSDQANAP